MLQYIGARYVPIFYENSLDPTSTEWEVNVTYEPMTWVSLPNGHMYISKKEVPANIGTPANNPTYWLEAGQYNAYIQSLQDQIDDMNDGTVSGSLQNQINTMNDGTVSGSLQNQINTIDNSVTNINNNISDINDALRFRTAKNVIAIGDSWGDTGSGSQIGWATPLQSVFTGDNLYTSCSGGYAWTRTNGKFITLLQNLVVPDDDLIDLVVIAGGVNESETTSTIAQMEQAMKDIVDYCETRFPNAFVVGIGLNCYITYNDQVHNCRIAGARSNGYKGRFAYVDYVEMIPPIWFDNSGYHLSQNVFYEDMAHLINNVIQGRVVTNLTLTSDWYTTTYGSNALIAADKICIDQRSVNGQREVRIRANNSSGKVDFANTFNIPNAVDYFTFSTDTGIAAKTPPHQLSTVYASTSSMTYFDGIMAGKIYGDGSFLKYNLWRNDKATISRMIIPESTFIMSM